MTIILDSNLLVLLIVGSADRLYIEKHRRLRSYTLEDFDLLLTILSRAASILVTPNTLTETSNLAGQVAEPIRSHVYQNFKALFADPPFVETFVETRAASARPEFLRLGLTDAALLHLADEPAYLLTADLDLYLAALNRGAQAENFNYLRNL